MVEQLKIIITKSLMTMKKFVKTLVVIFLFFVAIPLAAGFATTLLWNNILTSACGFSAIGIWQGVGIFMLGQILSAGFVLGGFFTVGSIHHIMGHRGGKFGRHWHNMTDEERRAFIERRAKFGFRHHHNQSNGDAAE